MNKTLLYLGAAIVGIGSAAALFMGGGDESAPPEVAVHSSGGSGATSQPVADLSGEPEAAEDAEVTPTKEEGMARRDGPEEGGDDEPYVSPQVEEMRRLMNAPYGQFTRVAGPAWTLMAMQLAEGGSEDLAAEARDVAMEIRRSRRDPNPDAAASAEKQRELMARIESAGVSGTSEQLARLDEMVTALENGETPPGFEDESTEGSAAE